MTTTNELRGLHEAGIRTTLAKLAYDEHVPTVEVSQETMLQLLQEVFDLRWQNRQLQARGTELLDANRSEKRKVDGLENAYKDSCDRLFAAGLTGPSEHSDLRERVENYGSTLAFLGRCIGEPVNRKALLERHPELFDDAEALLADLEEKFPHLFKDIPHPIDDEDDD